MTTPREDELFLAFKRRPGPETLAALLRGCQDSVYNLCHQVLRHPEDAEDVSQEVLVEAARALPSIDAPRQFKVWIYKAALHRSLNLKSARVRRIELARRIRVADSTPDLDDRTDLWLAIGDLDDRDRCLLLEHYFDKLTLEEIGAREGVSGVAIWKRLESARGQLRRALAGVAVVPLLEDFTPAVAPSGLVAKAVAAGGLIVGTKSVVSAGTLIAALLMIGAASTGGYLAGANRANARVRELEREVAKAPTLIPDKPADPQESTAVEESAPVAPKESAPAIADLKGKPGRRESVPDTTPIKYGRARKTNLEAILNATSWEEFYKELHAQKFIDVQKVEDLIFDRVTRELSLSSEDTITLRYLFQTEREEATRSIVENAGGAVGFWKVQEDLRTSGNAVYDDWRRQRDVVRRNFDPEYLKILSYDKLQLFNEHLRNTEIRLESSYSAEGRFHLIGGVGKPAK